MSDPASNIKILPIGDRIHPDALLEAARNASLKKVVILGWTEDGRFYNAGSENIESTIYLLRNSEHELFKMMDENEASA